jgi:excisionase family DNA binding protein
VIAMTSHATPLSVRRPARTRHGLPRLVSIEDVAEHLGVSVRHVRRLVFERRIPYVKWGHLVRFDIDEVNDWLANSRVAVVNDNDLGRHR